MPKRVRKKSEPTGIGEILDTLKQSGELAKSFTEAAIWERWPQIAGAHLMPFGRPIGIRDKTLMIEVSSAVWMHKYSYRKGAIVAAINRLFGPDLVEDLFFTLSQGEEEEETQDTV